MIISEISEAQIFRALKVMVGVLVKILQRSRINRVCVCICVCVCVCKRKRLMKFLLRHYGIGGVSAVG